MSIIANNKESLVWDEGREREILASAARSLLCQGMLMDIIYVVSSEGHFGRERERERERESI